MNAVERTKDEAVKEAPISRDRLVIELYKLEEAWDIVWDFDGESDRISGKGADPTLGHWCVQHHPAFIPILWCVDRITMEINVHSLAELRPTMEAMLAAGSAFRQVLADNLAGGVR